jgi:8-oxo-dGTP pyrophosphatase MutT (NUDIX family)
VPREPIPTWFFALVVVRKGHRFLVVHERAKSLGQTWYLPAGRVEPGESLADGARREALEESGVPIVLDGILRLEHTALPDSARVRVVFVGHPADDTEPKSVPDEETLGAAWRTLPELEELARQGLLRSDEVLTLIRAVEAGTFVAPLSLLATEGVS